MLAFMIMRDRVTYAKRCVAALEAAGLDVVIVDHDSAWLPARDWLHFMDAKRHARVFWDVSRHPRDLWNDYRPCGSVIREHVQLGERFVVTDCDVVPADDCPGDWLTTLGDLLDNNPAAVKAGLGLRTTDLPGHFAQRDRVQEWESVYQPPIAHPVGSWSAVWADIDTTLALYWGLGRGNVPFRLGPAIRTTSPYEALHLPWYEDSANLPEEIRFYNDRAEHGHWRAPDGFTDTHNLGGTV